MYVLFDRKKSISGGAIVSKIKLEREEHVMLFKVVHSLSIYIILYNISLNVGNIEIVLYLTLDFYFHLYELVYFWLF